MPVWDVSNAKHLLSRCLFGYSRKDLEKALSYSTVAEFDDKELLAERPLPSPPGDWITETPTNNALEGERYRTMTYWWYDLMLGEGTNMREKMTLFWHNHFVSERDKVGYPQHMYIQNNLFRRSAWGNFRQFVKDVTGFIGMEKSFAHCTPQQRQYTQRKLCSGSNGTVHTRHWQLY